jgi:hypothetical protein
LSGCHNQGAVPSATFCLCDGTVTLPDGKLGGQSVAEYVADGQRYCWIFQRIGAVAAGNHAFQVRLFKEWFTRSFEGGGRSHSCKSWQPLSD